MNKPLSKITYADLARLTRPDEAPAATPVAAQEEERKKEAGLKKVTHAEVMRLTQQDASSAAPVEISSSGASTVLASYPNVPAKGASDTSTDISATSASTSKPYERPNLEQLNTRLPRHFVEKIKLFAFTRRMPVAQLIQVALEDYIARASTVSGASTDSTTSTLLIDDKTDDDIINQYETLTAKKFTTGDRQTLAELRQKHHPDHIRVGILLSVLRTTKQINSLRYCTGAIAETATLSPQEAESYIAYLRKKAQRT
jgi:hypothetical protein